MMNIRHALAAVIVCTLLACGHTREQSTRNPSTVEQPQAHTNQQTRPKMRSQLQPLTRADLEAMQEDQQPVQQERSGFWLEGWEAVPDKRFFLFRHMRTQATIRAQFWSREKFTREKYIELVKEGLVKVTGEAGETITFVTPTDPSGDYELQLFEYHITQADGAVLHGLMAFRNTNDKSRGVYFRGEWAKKHEDEVIWDFITLVDYIRFK